MQNYSFYIFEHVSRRQT